MLARGAACVMESALWRRVALVSIDSGFNGFVADPGAETPLASTPTEFDDALTPAAGGLLGPRCRTAVENSQTNRRLVHRLQGLPPKHWDSQHWGRTSRNTLLTLALRIRQRSHA